MEKQLSHEKLKVYQKSLEFIEFVDKILKNKKDNLSVYIQLDESSTSICLNIAEGTGKYTFRDKNKFYDIARGSASECSACLDVLYIKKLISLEENQFGKNLLIEIISMLIGLVKSNSDRVFENLEIYSQQKL